MAKGWHMSFALVVVAAVVGTMVLGDDCPNNQWTNIRTECFLEIPEGIQSKAGYCQRQAVSAVLSRRGGVEICVVKLGVLRMVRQIGDDVYGGGIPNGRIPI